jgi:hypothetical protein
VFAHGGRSQGTLSSGQNLCARAVGIYLILLMIYGTFIVGAERTRVDPGAGLTTASGVRHGFALGTPGRARGLVRKKERPPDRDQD